ALGRRARNQRRELQIVPAVERKLDDALVLDHGPDRSGLGLKHWRATDDLQHIRDLSDLQAHVDSVHTADLHLDIPAFDGPKAGNLGLEAVRSWRQSPDRGKCGIVPVGTST